MKVDCGKGVGSEANTVDAGRQERQATTKTCERPGRREDRELKMIEERCFLTYNERKRSE